MGVIPANERQARPLQRPETEQGRRTDLLNESTNSDVDRGYLSKARAVVRETHGTFEDYCRERWGINSSRARQLISAAEVGKSLQGVTTVTPTNERQARPVTKLPPESLKRGAESRLNGVPGEGL
jgi:hypothetical protein